MRPRLFILLAGAFWVTMNVLLWRAEFGGRDRIGSPVSPEVVWQKVLTSPDPSSLEVVYRGKKIGFSRWLARVEEREVDGKRPWAPTAPEGMVRDRSGYEIDFEGNVAMAEFENRLGFDINVRMSTDHAWELVNIRVAMRPTVVEVQVSAAEQAVQLVVGGESGRVERVFKFDELRNPDRLIREFGGVWAAGLLGGAGLSPGVVNGFEGGLGAVWEARYDWMQFGHSSVRVYRLETRLLGRYPLVVYVSRVGEILRVELPNDVQLVNEQLLVL